MLKGKKKLALFVGLFIFLLIVTTPSFYNQIGKVRPSNYPRLLQNGDEGYYNASPNADLNDSVYDSYSESLIACIFDPYPDYDVQGLPSNYDFYELQIEYNTTNLSGENISIQVYNYTALTNETQYNITVNEETTFEYNLSTHQIQSNTIIVRFVDGDQVTDSVQSDIRFDYVRVYAYLYPTYTEDFVDSDAGSEDAQADLGTLANFGDMQSFGVTYATLTEEDTGGAGNNIEDFVDDEDTNIDGVGDIGSILTFANMQTYGTTYSTLQEANLGEDGYNVEDFVDNDTSNVGDPTDLGSLTNFANMQSYGTSYALLTESDEGGGGGGGGELPSARDFLSSDTTTSATFEDVDGLTVQHTVDYTSNITLFASIQATGSASGIGSWQLVYDGVSYQALDRQIGTESGNLMLVDLVPDKGAGTYTFKVQHKTDTGTLTTANALIVAISMHNTEGEIPSADSFVVSDSIGNAWEDITGSSTQITLSRESHIFVIMTLNGYFSANNKDADFAINIDATRMEIHDRDWSASNEYGCVSVITRTDSQKTAGTYIVKAESKGAGGAILTIEDISLVVIGAEANSGGRTLEIAKDVVLSASTTATSLESIAGSTLTVDVNNTAHVFGLLCLSTDVSVASTSAYTTIYLNGTDQDVMERGHPSTARWGSVGQIVRTTSKAVADADYNLTSRWYTDAGNTLQTVDVVLIGIVLYAGSESVSVNYRLDQEVQWTGLDFDNTNEYLCLFMNSTDAENIEVDVWTGSWTNLFSDLNPDAWNNISITAYLTSGTFTIRFVDDTIVGDSNQDSWQPNAGLIHTYNDPQDWELNQEIHFGTVDNDETNEIVCFYVNSSDAEDLGVYIWNNTESTWHLLFADITPDSWNNITVYNTIEYADIYIRFLGGSEVGDPTQSSWEINCALLHLYSEASANYELDQEVSFTSVSYSDEIENICFYVNSTDPEDLLVHVWKNHRVHGISYFLTLILIVGII